MGHGSFTSSSWSSFSRAHTAGKTTSAIFTKHAIDADLDPAQVAIRESCDGPDHPEATPISIFFDVTGSMGEIPSYFVKEGLRTVFEEIYARKPVSDPQIQIGAIGDVDHSNECHGGHGHSRTGWGAGHGDRSPLQVSQFESDIRVAEQLIKIHLEGNGGGNMNESYTLAWYFAAMKTKLDSLIKRGKKGYLFTIGDEFPPAKLTAEQLKKVFGPGEYTDLTAEQLYQMASEKFHIYHIFVEQGSYKSMQEEIRVSFSKIGLGENVLPLSDYTKLGEVIVSAIEQNEGKDAEAVAASWSGGTSLVVRHAMGGLTKRTGNVLTEKSAAVAF
jgi:hypothetical protein